MITDFKPHSGSSNAARNTSAGFPRRRFVSLVKSLLHNIGVVLVGFGVAFLGAVLDSLCGFIAFTFRASTIAAWLLLAGGFLLRVWATAQFYQQRMKVISLVPQKKLITSGAYRFSRNPLYLGGNVFISWGRRYFSVHQWGSF
jgi:protein-S-isoprenylcysteine O-methyltransferase Ste14